VENLCDMVLAACGESPLDSICDYLDTFRIKYRLYKGSQTQIVRGPTDNFEIYGGPHVIFSNIWLSILFKIKHNIKTTPLHYYYFVIIN
jgi:hypothetical protein